MNDFLPTTLSEMSDRGWDALDVIIVTGDAYVDHPSYGGALIGRVLESDGFKVGIMPQPDIKDPGSFKRLGKPRLFFGVTSGNLDSMVANYTANKRLRGEDEYSPGGKTGLRPDRATLVYVNRIKAAFSGVPVVIGGMEASMRRLAHYDYWSDTVRRSILIDSKADILVYGMGERQISEIASRLNKGEAVDDLTDIRGTVILKNSIDSIKDAVLIPSFEEVKENKKKFNDALRLAYLEQDPVRGRTVIQPHALRYIIQLPCAKPLSSQDMDRIYELPFLKKPHPCYTAKGGVPGFSAVKNSIISHRGCPGECNFCSLYAHQGRIVQSRSPESILKEIVRLSEDHGFNGTITDIGGPTANLYAARCDLWPVKGSCRDRRCMVPDKCKNLKLGYDKTLDIWRRAKAIPGVKHIFVGSGLRYDLLNRQESDEYLKELCRSHISGLLKVAPEHTESHVLDIMGKPRFDSYERFRKRFESDNKKLEKKQHLVNYLITGHPGTTLKDAINAALKLKDMRIYPEQIQDYIPLPMTLSGAMYHTGSDPLTGRDVFTAKKPRDRKLQRALMQFRNKDNKRYVIEALTREGKMNLMKQFYG